MSEAVDLDEYARHFGTVLKQLRDCSGRIVVISETPFGPIEAPETFAAMNAELARYNEAAHAAAIAHGALVLDVCTPFTAAARHISPSHDGASLRSDGVHLSELGEELLQQAEQLLAEHRVIEKLLDYASWSATPR
ncbi:GDSL-type esterase/lipase family protein [Streptomyces sp. NPDC001880]